ncbi:hypothetical protein ACCD10_27590 [Pseudomonas sp. Pseusp122]|jgi:hypothetical protein|uniref:hypothetical protein n=1 Tax=unclassified Pseudomonas TaxID=196821 RepID=UPI0039A706CE
MRITTRKCLAVIAATAVLAIYGAGAYRIEMARQGPHLASCNFGHCYPTSATFAALR